MANISQPEPVKINAVLPQPEAEFIRAVQQALLEPLAQYVAETMRRSHSRNEAASQRRAA